MGSGTATRRRPKRRGRRHEYREFGVKVDERQWRDATLVQHWACADDRAHGGIRKAQPPGMFLFFFSLWRGHDENFFPNKPWKRMGIPIEASKRRLRCEGWRCSDLDWMPRGELISGWPIEGSQYDRRGIDGIDHNRHEGTRWGDQEQAERE